MCCGTEIGHAAANPAATDRNMVPGWSVCVCSTMRFDGMFLRPHRHVFPDTPLFKLKFKTARLSHSLHASSESEPNGQLTRPAPGPRLGGTAKSRESLLVHFAITHF
ncbi:uncharacterized protein LOC120424020 [Culex pipiens pallens]|uniref:uncharacterized protein LOC120424020 n=1 Tax=Culex pipiens pallens TaxID=42434 RepID=UPI0022AA3608|nr:uncharacterized protein LOC120424020 [Culex pipiens pallens]